LSGELNERGREGEGTMKIAKGLIPILTLLWVLGPLGSPAQGAVMGIQIEVQVDSGSGLVSAGTASGEDEILDVAVSPGDTLRFTISLVGDPDSSFLERYTTDVFGADDPTEIDYFELSALDLTGLGFHATGNPENTLTDGDPGDGFVDADPGSVAFVENMALYELEYTVQPGLNSDGFSDFNVLLNGITSNPLLDFVATDGSEKAKVRLNVAIPEPGTLLLLGSGLAGLGVIRSRRKRH
jgi:hypothetical protein